MTQKQTRTQLAACSSQLEGSAELQATAKRSYVMRKAYMDHAATTPVDPAVLKAMLPYFSVAFANPSSLHSAGQEALAGVKQARKKIAEILNGHEDEVVFTSGGTESDNLAICGIVNSVTQPPLLRGATPKGVGGSIPHVITTEIEHHAVLEPLNHLEKTGKIELTKIKSGPDGVVNVKDVLDAIKSNTILVSVIHANNEIGTIQPVEEIGKGILKWRKANSSIYPYLHTDACQSAGYLDINVEKLHVDLLTLNGGKVYGPKGIGLLFVRRGTKIQPVLRGGGQEKGLRSGTENVPGIVGLAKALELTHAHKQDETARLEFLRDRLIQGLLRISKTRLNGHAEKRLPNNVNISFMDIEGEAAMLYLDAKGVQCSTGSACASSSLDPSHVILALGMSYEAAHGSLRFTLGKSTTKADVDYVIKIMPGIVERLRKMSPVSLDMKHF